MPSRRQISRQHSAVAAALVTATILFASSAHAAGDADEGAKVYRRCAICHTSEQDGANKIGPNLWAVFGNKSGTRRTGFRYSDALRQAAITWDDDTLNQLIKNPRTLVPGTRMAFPGLPDPQEREDVIAYLRQITR